MSKKTLPVQDSQWVGFRFPVRPVTTDEFDILSPICAVCPLPAVAVELQEPLTADNAQKPLIEFEKDALKFFCAYHTTCDLPPELVQATSFSHYLQFRKQISCPKLGQRRYMSNCLIHQPRCLKHCKPIKEVLGDLPLQAARDIAVRGRELELQQKGAANEPAGQKDPEA